MPQNPTYSCYLGAINWEHAGWVGKFYPYDLPEEWRLAYYNTHFSCVYLSRTQWSGVAPDVWQQWLGDLQPHFRLVLQTAPDLTQAELALFSSLSPYVGLCDGPALQNFRNCGSLLWLGPTLQLKELAAETMAAPKPVYLIARTADLAVLEQVATLIEVIGC